MIEETSRRHSRGARRARGHYAGASRGGRECAAGKRGARVRRLHGRNACDGHLLVFCFLCDVWKKSEWEKMSGLRESRSR